MKHEPIDWPAARLGTGVRLTAEECRFMSFDSSIETAAGNIRMGEPIDNGRFYMSKDGIFEKEDDHERQ